MATIIYNATQLQAMSGDLTADYELGSDIDASATVGWNGGLGFAPIGDNINPFTGNFDGKGYIITDLYIDRPATRYIGLFGYITTAVEVKNVGLVNCDITGARCTGALVGYNGDGTNISAISNCYSSGAVKGDGVAWIGCLGGLVGYNKLLSTITDCYSTAAISVDASAGAFATNEIGGLVGLNDGIITRCPATGNVTVIGAVGKDVTVVGGFVGRSDNGEIIRCCATGNVVVNDAAAALDDVWGFGGFCGENNSADIVDCYARGNVSVKAGVGGTQGYVGGFSGLSSDDIDNCYSTGLITVIGMANVGGFVGDNYGAGTVIDSFWDTETSGQAVSDGGTGKTTAQMKDIATFQAAGWAISRIWNLYSGCNDGYPCLIDVNACCPQAQVADKTIVGDKVSLEAIRNLEIVYGGRFYIGKSGTAVYESRYHRNV